ncbi:hypothetical protein VNO77_16035 [Canavalia gladiata]|uniref:Uncharacterized protein n=1 Tax=Canavalia gladiata TaxID=3824 RepID=A0AAN9M120_CANGL
MIVFFSVRIARKDQVSSNLLLYYFNTCHQSTPNFNFSELLYLHEACLLLKQRFPAIRLAFIDRITRYHSLVRV